MKVALSLCLWLSVVSSLTARASGPVHNERQIFCALKYRLIAPGFSWDFLQRPAAAISDARESARSPMPSSLVSPRERDRPTRFPKSRSISCFTRDRALYILSDNLSPSFATTLYTYEIQTHYRNFISRLYCRNVSRQYNKRKKRKNRSLKNVQDNK